jgi:hypothetical protein
VHVKLQIFSIAITAGIFMLVFDLVRRQRMMERYALLWLFGAATLLVLAAWQGLLNSVSRALGIFYGTSLLFAVAFGFVLILLLHICLVVSRLTDQNKVLAQRVGLLQQQIDKLEAGQEREPSNPSSASRRPHSEGLTGSGRQPSGT